MKVIDFEGFGGAEVLRFSERPMPECGPEQILIRVKAAGVNRADILQRQGHYPPPKGEIDIPGLEVSGEVIEIGASVSQFSCGDKVCALVAGGGYAEYAVAHASHALPLPDSLSFVQGAGLMEVFITAYQTLFFIGNLGAQQHVLIHAGASGVGTAAIQLAKSIGAEVSVTVGSEEKAAACTALGADRAINYRQHDFVEQLKPQRPVDLVLDMVAGDYINKALNVLAMDARIVVIAIQGGRFVEKLDMGRLLAKRASVTASTLRNQPDDYTSDLIQGFWRVFGDKIESGEIRPLIHTQLPYSEIGQLHKIMEANTNTGKLIMTF